MNMEPFDGTISTIAIIIPAQLRPERNNIQKFGNISRVHGQSEKRNIPREGTAFWDSLQPKW